MPTAGGKGANLGEMLRSGLPVPEGFVLLVDAYRKYVEANDLEKEIGRLLAGLDDADQKEASKSIEKLKGLFAQKEIPVDIKAELDHIYEKLGFAVERKGCILPGQAKDR